jgi:hypothetical protein
MIVNCKLIVNPLHLLFSGLWQAKALVTTEEMTTLEEVAIMGID